MEIDRDILAALHPRCLIEAYTQGAFPMVEDGRLTWFSPTHRGLLPLDGTFHVPRRLARLIRSGKYVCTVDRSFDQIVRLCSQRGEEGTWISPEIRIAFGQLHQLGAAHSVEAWPAGAVGAGAPAGGLYGVAVGGAFFAESMFHRATDAGKVAMAFLVERLVRRGFGLCDIQWVTDNLARYGAYELDQDEYTEALPRTLKLDCSFAP